jgi:glycosyltransferase involved in cell wall biosynthesis
MRIAIASEFPLAPDRVFGGLEALSRGLARRIARDASHEVHVVSFHASLAAAHLERVEGVSVHRFPLPERFGNLTWGAQERSLTVEALRRIQPDVVHSLGLGPKALAVKAAGFPWVVSVNGIRSNEARAAGGLKNRVRASVCRSMERAGLRAARHVIFPSPFVRSLLAEAVTGARTHIIENAVDPEFFEIGAEASPRTILCVGRVIPLKAPEVLIDAVHLLAESGLDVEARFVGPPDEASYLEHLEERARHLGISGRVRFLGFVPDWVLLREMGNAGILAHPSRVEIAPLSVMQAMAAGRPVVATNVGGTPYLVEDGKTGFLVPPGDAPKLASRLRSLLEDTELRAEFAAAARRQAERRFRIERAVEDTLSVYEQVSARPSRNALESTGSRGCNRLKLLGLMQDSHQPPAKDG